MSPFTLEFSDAQLEEQIKGAQIIKGHYVLPMLTGLVILFSVIAGYGLTCFSMVVLLFMTVACGVIYFGENACNYSHYQIHQIVARLHESTWLLSSVLFWWKTYQGTSKRLGPEQTEQMVGCCCLWIVAFIMPRLLHISMTRRTPLYLHALVVVVTSPHWNRHLLLSMVLGEGVGYTFERILRESFLSRHQSLQRLEREKERMEYEMLFAKHRSETLLSHREGTLRSDHHLNDYADGESNGDSSCGTNSELGALISRASFTSKGRSSDAGLDGNKGGDYGLLARRREDALWSSLAAVGIKPHDH